MSRFQDLWTWIEDSFILSKSNARPQPLSDAQRDCLYRRFARLDGSYAERREIKLSQRQLRLCRQRFALRYHPMWVYVLGEKSEEKYYMLLSAQISAVQEDHVVVTLTLELSVRKEIECLAR